MKAHKFKLTKHVREILEINKIHKNLIFKNNGEVAKIFKIKISEDFEKLNKTEKARLTAKFREYLENTKSEIQINLITNNYYADTYIERIKKQIKEKQEKINPEAVPSIKNLIHFIENQTRGVRPVREYYITISFDDYRLKNYEGIDKLKKVLSNNFYARLSNLNKAVFGKRIIKFENDLADTQIYNYQRQKKLDKFMEEETDLIRNFFEVKELEEQEIISLYNSHFYENIYSSDKYYTILDYIDIYAKQTKDKFYDDLMNIFKWELKSDFTSAEINHKHFRILSFFEYPIKIKQDFWEFMISHGGNFNMSFFFKQTTDKMVVEDLENRRKILEEKSSESKQLGYLDEELTGQIDRINNIISFVKEEQEKTFIMSAYMLLKEIDKSKIQKFSDEIAILLNENGVVFKIQPLKNIIKDFDILLPINKNDMKNYKFLSSTTIMNMYPFLWNFNNIQNRDKIKEFHK